MSFNLAGGNLKFQYKELQKALDYISKHGDQAFVVIKTINPDTAFEGIVLEFKNNEDDQVSIFLPTNEKAFSKITTSERF